MMLASLLTLQDSDFPTDVDFKWAQDSYNVTQRNIDTWLFFGTFRSQLWLLDQKWSYAGGFTGKEPRHGWCCVQSAAVLLKKLFLLKGWLGIHGSDAVLPVCSCQHHAGRHHS
jgi:hypothetical protein